MKKEKHYNCSWHIPALLPLSTSCLLVMKTVVMTAAEMVMIRVDRQLVRMGYRFLVRGCKGL